jgi:hypothetical protein
MAVIANVVSQQSLQFDVPGIAPAGATRVFMTTGIAQFFLAAQSPGPNSVSQSTGVKLLVQPVIAPGQFRRATAVVALANLQHQDANAVPGQASTGQWQIDDVAASLDDESGQVELRFDVAVNAFGTNTFTALTAVTFQVTSIAAI